MKPGIPASERSRHAYEVRKPGPVRRLSLEEIKALEHKRNLDRFLRRHTTGPDSK